MYTIYQFKDTKMETAPKKRGRPRIVKMEKRSPQPEDLEEILQDMDEEPINEFDYIPNGMPDYLIIKNKKNINNNEDIYDFDVEKEDGPGISNLILKIFLRVISKNHILLLIHICIVLKDNVKSEENPETVLLEHACDICPRTFKTLPGLKRHKTSHDRKPRESIGE